MESLDDGNPYLPKAPIEENLSQSSPRGFRRGVRNGFWYSLPFALILGFTVFGYAFFQPGDRVSDFS
ncbi:MAG: hypothetical protein AAF664_01585, partial [Planctomycetota bacterium]